MQIKLIAEAIYALLKRPDLHTVTAFFPPLSDVKKRVRVTRVKNGNGYHLKIGRPNYAERQFLKLCKKAGARPRRLWFKTFPVPRKK